MNGIVRLTKNIVCIAFIVAATFFAGYFYAGLNDEPNEVVVREETTDLELPLEIERQVVTEEEIRTKLDEIGELSTYSGKYTYTLSKEETRYLLEDIPVLGSTNSISISCDGIVKIGYDISDIAIKVDGDTIYVAIPEAQVNDNYVIWDSLICTESNNILNPIEFSQYQDMIAEIERKGMEDVISKGIYSKAENNLKKLISAFLSEFRDYEVVFL